MLTYSQLVTLERALRDERVLSVYLRGAAGDPASRLAWRTDLDRSLRDLRRWLAGSSHEEREAFERCVALLDELLAPYRSGLSSPGWAAFITDGVVQDAERLPVPMPTMAIWSTGMCVSPYIRALKVTRPVIVAVVDARLARIYRFQAGELSLIARIHAHATIDAPAHMGDAPRHGFHGGVRGETGHDAAKRARAAGTERMLRESELVVARHASIDGGILVGGASRIATQFKKMLAGSVSERVLQLESLHADASDSDILAAAKVGASALRNATDLRQIAEIASTDADHDAAALGPAATRRALERHTVRDLYITGRYLEEHMAEAEDAVRQALDQGASIEQVSNDAAARLDEHGGIAARLRYRAIGETPGAGALVHDADGVRSATH
ncbi:MAG TPA: hypothetical protein VFW03_02750 [Gemmatimonadaceae bacterium]|nr:hypothetical protein [Gemmatimonadaceae bacterium]